MTTGTTLPAEAILQLQQDAETMTCKQMAEKHGTTSQAMRSRLERLGIEPRRIRNKWAARLDELKGLAARMTPQELAEHFGTSADYVYVLLSRLKIKAVSVWPVRFEGGIEALKQHAPSMTIAELAAHLEATPRTVRVHLKRLGLECKQVEPAPRASKPPPKPKRVAAKKPAPRAKSRPKQKAKPAPKSAPVAQRPAAAKPPIRREAQVIMPASAKITILDFRPPANTRICNGSSTERYDPKARAISVRGGY